MFTCAFVAAALLSVAPAQAQFNAPRPAVPAEDYHVELGVNFWQPTPDLVIRTDAAGIAGSDVDFVQEFGIAKKRFTEFRATLKPGRKHKLRVDHVPFKYEADATINRTFTFAGREYTVGVPASTAVKWDLWKFGYEWDVVSGNGGFVGLVVDVKYNRVSAEISSPAFGAELTEAKAPVPGVGGIARAYLSKYFSVTGEFTTFKMPDKVSESIDGKFADFDLYGTLNLGRNLGVQGGYRSITADYAQDEDAGALKMKGPYFGGVLRF